MGHRLPGCEAAQTSGCEAAQTSWLRSSTDFLVAKQHRLPGCEAAQTSWLRSKGGWLERWVGHLLQVTTGADEDVRATAGREAGATSGVWRYFGSMALLRKCWRCFGSMALLREYGAASGAANRELRFPMSQNRDMEHHGLTVGEIGTLPDFDDVTVRIADVAANLAVLGNRLGDEVGSSTFP